MKALVKAADLPIFIVKYPGAFVETAGNGAFAPESGVLFGDGLINRLGSPDLRVRESTQHEIMRLLMPPLFPHALAAGYVDPQIKDRRVLKEVQKEFMAQAPHFDFGPDTTPLSADPNARLYGRMMSDMHFLLNTALNDPATVRAAMPICTAAYDRCMEKLTQLAQQVDPGVPDYKVPVVPIPAPTTTLPFADLDRWDRHVHTLFLETPEGREREAALRTSVRPQIEHALSSEPPFNQCYVRLIHSTPSQDAKLSAADQGHRLHVVFRNDQRQSYPFNVSTGTSNLDDAVTLKRALQSYLLSLPGVSAAFLPGISRNSQSGETIV